MNINIENYEEFFLLYADNELTQQQRSIVEMFVRANPHLKKEFDDILLTVQQPDDIHLPDKELLFKTPAEDFIDDTNFEERFVAYHDGELTSEEQEYVRQFVNGREELKQEFSLIGMARLEPDMSVYFPDKERLFKKGVRVVYINVSRIAAAAVFAGLVIWFGAQQTTETTPASSGAGMVAQTPPPGQTGDQPSIAMEHETSEKTEENKTSGAEAGMTHYAGHSTSKQDNQQLAKTRKREIDNGNGAIAKEEDKVANRFVADNRPPTGNGIDEKLIAAVVNPKSEIKQEAVVVSMPADRELFPKSEEAPAVRYASFASNTREDEYVFLDIPAENIRRSKIGILFKKVKRTIDRNNPINRLFNGDEIE